MRLSQVPVRSVDRHGLLFDPGGLSRGSPITPRQMLRSGTLKPSAFAKVTQAATFVSPLRDHIFQTTFGAQSHTLPSRSARLPTFVSSGRRASLLGWWLAFAQGGFPPPGLRKPISAGSHPRFPRLRI